MPRYLMGFDMGATKMLCAVLDDTNKIIVKNKVRTKGSGNDEIFSTICRCIDDCLAKLAPDSPRPDGIGIACPGPIDEVNGIVQSAPNVGVEDFPLRDLLEDRYAVPVRLENDVNAGIYGEFVAGAARGRQHVIGLFPGTGLGGGIIIDGKLYAGATGGAGEIGHMTVQTDGRICGCGGYGCLEALASRSAIAKDAVAAAAGGDAPTLYAEIGTDLKKVTSGVLKRSVDGGDVVVKRIVERAAYFLGIGMANCVNIFNPELIVIGGGLVEKFGSEYLGVAESVMRERAMSSLAGTVVVSAAELGDYATVIGAAARLSDKLETAKSTAKSSAGAPKK
ncbi:MAG: ROK family protein [Spirochaetaceae bacterium]|nr:MAG: ROK family protein [Spirochaetaceae bacterium]